jgi:hypothetical protein
VSQCSDDLDNQAAGIRLEAAETQKRFWETKLKAAESELDYWDRMNKKISEST